MDMQARIGKIMGSAEMSEWVNGVGTNNYGCGQTYTLYLDTDNDTLFIDCQATSNTWLCREDGSLLSIATYSNPDDETCTPWDGWEESYRLDLERDLGRALMPW